MLIRLFKSGLPAQALGLLIVVVILWFNAFYGHFSVPSFAGYPIQEAMLGAITGNFMVSAALQLLMIIFLALVFNLYITNNDYVPRNTLLPAFFFILFFSHSPDLFYLNPVSIPTIILMIVLINTLKMNDLEEPYVLVFNTAFFAAIATLLYPPAIVFLVFIWFSFLVNGILKWREWVISILGYVLPFVFALMAYFWFNNLPGFLQNHLPKVFLHWNDVPVPATTEIIVSVIIAILFFTGFRKVLSVQMGKLISFRKSTWTMLWFSFFSMASIVFAGKDYLFHLALLTIPAIAFISYYFMNHRRGNKMEILVWLLLVIVVLHNTGAF